MGFANVDYNIVNLDVDDLDDGLDDGTYFRNDIGLLNFDLDDDDTINLIIRLITLCKRYYQCKRWSKKKKKERKKDKNFMSTHDVQHDGKIGICHKMEKKVQNNCEDEWNRKSIINI